MYVERIPFHEFHFETMRSRGPGGQNVNRTNSAVVLRFNVVQTLALTPEQKDKVRARLSSKITSDGELLIRSEESRDQDQNRKSCLEKLEKLLHQALFEHKKRKATKPTKSSQRRRVDEKRNRSEIKAGRKKSWT